MITVNNLDNIEIIPLIETLSIQKISDEKYFSNKYSNYISNSRLSLINPLQDNNPVSFFEGFNGNSYNDSLLLGSSVHQLVLQPESFILADCVDRPTAKLGFVADELYPFYLQNSLTEYNIVNVSNKVGYYKDKLNSDRINFILESCSQYWSNREKFEKTLVDKKATPIYLDNKSRERVLGCIDSLKKNSYISSLLSPGRVCLPPISENEQAILLDIEVRVPGYNPFVLKLKAKVDHYSIDSILNTIIVNDIKTIGKVLSEFSNNFERFHYYRELAIYSWLLSLVAYKFHNLKNCKIQSNCLVVSTISSYYSKVYTVTRKDFIKGWNEFKYLMRLVAHYYSNGYRFK